MSLLLETVVETPQTVTYSPFMIEAVYSVAHGLHQFLEENCASPVEWNRATESCNGQKRALNGSVLFDYGPSNNRMINIICFLPYLFSLKQSLSTLSKGNVKLLNN